uniref:Putative secreted protein n=1 Tax=Ixodes ricinus TaxID=34613 RepID=A0A6B0UPM2_IXORI
MSGLMTRRYRAVAMHVIIIIHSCGVPSVPHPYACNLETVYEQCIPVNKAIALDFIRHQKSRPDTHAASLHDSDICAGKKTASLHRTMTHRSFPMCAPRSNPAGGVGTLTPRLCCPGCVGTSVGT